MKKGGVGIGSASILLVFAVLCLEVFSVISLSTARADKVMTDKLEETVASYYEADLLAERVIETILASDGIPASACGINLNAADNIVSYYCPVSEDKELYVEAKIDGSDVDVLEWRVISTGEWVIDDDFPVWTGE